MLIGSKRFGATLAGQDLSITLVCEVYDLERGYFDRATFDDLKVTTALLVGC